MKYEKTLRNVLNKYDNAALVITQDKNNQYFKIRKFQILVFYPSPYISDTSSTVREHKLNSTILILKFIYSGNINTNRMQRSKICG